MKILDMRMRPPFGGFLDGILYNVEGNRRMAERRGLEMAPSVLEKSMDLLLQEMDDSGGPRSRYHPEDQWVPQ